MWLISLAKESVPLQLKAGQPRKGQLMWGVNNLKIPEGLLCSSGGCFSFESVTHHNFLYYKKNNKLKTRDIASEVHSSFYFPSEGDKYDFCKRNCGKAAKKLSHYGIMEQSSLN